MPYINQIARERIKAGNIKPLSAGELNFAITSLVHEFLNRVGTSYSTLNEVIGVLECAKLELYRRVAAPYEDGAIARNGDLLP